MIAIPNDAVPFQLQVSKAIANLKLIARSYALSGWSEEYAQKLVHDISIMRVYGDAHSVRLEVFDSTNSIIFQHSENFTGNGQRSIDSGGGLEIPVIPRHLVKDWRIVVPPRLSPEYVPRLLLNWGPAPDRSLARGSEFDSDHVTKMTGGRTDGKIYVGDVARHTGTITLVKGDYGFARDDKLDADIFVHGRYVPDKALLRQGRRVSYVVTQTPRGLQARLVRNAA